jgi:hypothetical protein
VEDSDVIVMADVLYNDELASHVARLCQEIYLIKTTSNTQFSNILITDSQRFVHRFEWDINFRLKSLYDNQKEIITNNTSTYKVNTSYDYIYWQNRTLLQFTGSGVLINDDQTYDVTARILWI